MKTLNYWNAFMNSGKIEDYLSFKKEETNIGSSQKEEQVGESPYAGVSDCNRNDFKSSSDWGI